MITFCLYLLNVLFQQKALIEDLEETLSELKGQLKEIRESYEEEEKASSTYKFKHISEIDSGSRLIGAQTLKVRLYPNGVNCSKPIKIFLDIKQLKKATATKLQAVKNFLNMINALRELPMLFGVYGTKIIVKRTFLINGSEIDDLGIIGQDEQIWLSLGEAFVPINCKYRTFIHNNFD